LVLAACGLHCDTPPPATLPQATFAYVANLADNTVSIYAADRVSGQWHPRGYVVSAGAQPYAVATHPTGKFVYVTADTSATVAAYAIDATSGFLALVSNSTAGTNPQSIAISASGEFAYVANRNIGGSGSVSTYAIDATTGALSSSPIDSDPAGGEPHSITLDPSGKFAYTANFATNDISVFTINAGVLSSAGTAPVGAGTNPNYLVIHPSAKFAYTANWGNGTVSVFSIDGTSGALSAHGAVSTGSANPAILALDPSGKFLFVTNFDAGNVAPSVAAFSIDPNNGALSSVPGSPFATSLNPHFVEVDPAGKFVYVGNFGGHSVSSFTLDGTTGALTPLADTPEVATRFFPVTFAINRGAAAVTQVPKFAFVANAATDDVTAYGVAANGDLAKVNCVAGVGVVCGSTDATNFATGTESPSILVSITVDRWSRFAYVANIASNDVNAYSIGSNGMLTKINCVAGGGVVCGSTDPTGFGTGGGPISIVVDPSGRFAYVANAASSDINAYSVAANGVLTKINCVAGGGVVCGATDPTNFAAGDNPQAVTIDPSGRFAYVANAASNDATAYLINVATGALIKINCVAGGGVVCGATDPSNFAAGTTPISFTIEATGRFAYVTHGSLGNDISAFALGANGVLTKINCVAGGGVVCGATDPTNFAAGGHPAVVAVNPSSNHAYAANTFGDDVTAYDIDGNGMLAAISCIPGNGLVCNNANMVAGTGPVAVAIDPTGNYAYVANQDSNNVSAFRAVAGGLFSETRYFAAGTKPTSIVVTGGYQ
jgi:6-phosphogluconolactonase (cycloisomerase 2 family)